MLFFFFLIFLLFQGCHFYSAHSSKRLGKNYMWIFLPINALFNIVKCKLIRDVIIIGLLYSLPKRSMAIVGDKDDPHGPNFTYKWLYTNISGNDWRYLRSHLLYIRWTYRTQGTRMYKGGNVNRYQDIWALPVPCSEDQSETHDLQFI